jgi:pseudouridine-5'-phosphate glycosidase
LQVLIVVAQEVADAVATDQATVALESTIIAHGFPRPDNLDLANALEQEVRDARAVPATIGILDGAAHIGLDQRQLARIASDDGVRKCSLRDIAALVSERATGAATVAATAHLAAKAGVSVFATGGIGGVHPGGEVPDISADLMALARTPIAVVCAGAKSILDIPATLEVLESLSVPVIGYRCRQFPAFHTAESGHDVPHSFENLDDLARMVATHRALDLPGGILVCNPPPEAEAMSRKEIDALIRSAEAEARDAHVTGPGLTPFLLAALDRLSNGRTTAVNRALALSNAALAGGLAVALAKQGRAR